MALILGAVLWIQRSVAPVKAPASRRKEAPA